jgi:hypothetical protein
VRSDAESTVIVVWLVLGTMIPVGVVYSALSGGGWTVHLIVLAVGELVLAGLGRLALRKARRW